MISRVFYCVQPLKRTENREQRTKTIRAQECAMVNDLLRQIGSSAANVVIKHHENGQPYLSDFPDICVSISHSKNALAVAIAKGMKVGIDIESRRKINNSLEYRVCNEEELKEIHSSKDPEMTFLKFWTRKEAVLKMKGTGIHGFGSLINILKEEYEIEDLTLNNPDWVGAIATGE